MERAYDRDVEPGGFLEQRLHGSAVFSDDAEIVSSRFARPVLVRVERAELAERIRREEDLVFCVVSHHDLRPVNHRRKDEIQLMLAERESVAVFDGKRIFDEIPAVEVLYHRESLVVADYHGVGISCGKFRDARRVVGLHVLNYEIIGLPAGERRFEIFEPFGGEVPVHRVHDGNLFVENDI